MLNSFRPNEVAPALEKVDLDKLKERGIRGIICDIDNTVLPWDACTPEEDVCRWIKRAKDMGFSVALLSNAFPKRARSMSRLLGVPANGQAVKPTRRGFIRVLQQLNLEAEETAVIGDQIFTDIWGGNRLNMYTILVPPLGEKEFFTTKFLRYLERLIKERLDLVT